MIPAGCWSYYSRRAREYDRIYERPERREDLASLVAAVRELTAGRHVLELACGTGWWTKEIAPVARAVTATDASSEVLEVARARGLPRHVELRAADAFEPQAIEGAFDCAVAGFWLSHLKRAETGLFLDALHERIGFGARVVLFDNRFVEGSSTPVTRRDPAGDTYQARRLEDGTEYEVLKNFLAGPELRLMLRGRAKSVDLRELRYYWLVAYTVER